MKAKRASAQVPSPQTEEQENAQSTGDPGEDQQVKPTPILIVLGIVVLLAGLISGILMSQATFIR